jgi:nucleotide-binding universal stress UspA family protein
MSEMQDTNLIVENTPALSIIIPIHKGSNSYQPFVHALKLAYSSKGELEIVDVREEQEATEHLGVRELLEKWGILPDNAHRSDVMDIGLKVKKVVKSGNKKKEIKKRLDRHPHDLLVIGTDSKPGIGFPFGHDLAEYLAEYFNRTTLFIPSDSRPFINESTGKASLKKILVPVENTHSGNIALSKLKSLLLLFPECSPEVIALHVGKEFPQIERSNTDGLNLRTELKSEPLIGSILMLAGKYDVDLIVMATKGKSFKLIGSNTEKVLRGSNRPLLSVSMH